MTEGKSQREMEFRGGQEAFPSATWERETSVTYMGNLTRRLFLLSATLILAPIPSMVIGTMLYFQFFAPANFTHQNAVEELRVIWSTTFFCIWAMLVGLVAFFWGLMRYFLRLKLS
jgi:hypothetical protein